MKCLSCGDPSLPDAGACARCGATPEGSRELLDRVRAGQQFAFFRASADRPLFVGIDGESRCLKGPTIVSLHEHSIEFAAHGPRFRGLHQQEWEPVHFEKLELPTLKLVALVTDRKIYHPRDQAQVFMAAPNWPGEDVELEVRKFDQRVQQMRFTLDDAGLRLCRIQALEEGEYQVHARVVSRPSADATCSFACAEFTLSTLQATLLSHVRDGNKLQLEVQVTALGAPYEGEADIALVAGRVARVDQKRVRISGGRICETFGAHPWYPDLRLTITTPDGSTASVPIPGTRPEEQGRTLLSALDRPVWGALSPFRGAEGSIRGLHYAREKENTLPFAMESIQGTEGRIIVRRDVVCAQLLIFDPLTGEFKKYEFKDVKKGDALCFPVEPPYRLFTIGAIFKQGQPHEAWGTVFHPETLKAEMAAPKTALPGDRIVVRVESNRPSQCLLLVYDARLEHESPAARLSQCIFGHLEESSQSLAAGRAVKPGLGGETFAAFSGSGFQMEMMESRLSAPLGDVQYCLSAPSESGLRMAPGVEGLSTELDSLLTTNRESFAELAHIELFPVNGNVERAVGLSDQIGTWRCRAYLFSGLDWVELTRDVEARQELFAEMDLPAVLGDGDEVQAQIRYHAEGEAVLTVTSPSGKSEHPVSGDGRVEVPIRGPGEVVAEITSGGRADHSRRTVKAPGIDTVTASRIQILTRGEVATGKRVAVFPEMSYVVQETVEALIQYPYG